ncbi:hypothetical protein ACWD95_45120, partial [Streptomyces sp. NPDC005069]
EERGKLTALADLPLDEHVTVVAQVADARIIPARVGVHAGEHGSYGREQRPPIRTGVRRRTS